MNTQEKFSEFIKFFRIPWNRLYSKMRDCVLANKECEIERKHFSAYFGGLHQILLSDCCLQEFASVLGMNSQELSRQYHCILTEVINRINTVLIHFLQQANVPDTVPSLIFRSLSSMPDESKRKVRHCMGWAISRE